MGDHAWTVETLDGGPMGAGDFWLCSGCGASGGPILRRKTPDGAVAKKPRWEPFLAGMGHALKLSHDCDETSAIIRQHTLSCVERLSKERRDVSPDYAGLLRAALDCSPNKKDVTLVFHVYLDLVMRKHAPPAPLDELRRQILMAGFWVVANPSGCADYPEGRGRE
jgi:hypothetical protein